MCLGDTGRGVRMTTTQKPVTAEELLMMPDKDLRTELVRGEVRRMAPAGNVHGRFAVKVAARLLQHVEDNDLGVVYTAETGFKPGWELPVADVFR